MGLQASLALPLRTPVAARAAVAVDALLLSCMVLWRQRDAIWSLQLMWQCHDVDDLLEERFLS
jgi:hypothetical protein